MGSEKTQQREAEFDAFAEDYDTALNEGLKLSGEGKDYFAEGRMRWLARCLAALGNTPKHALDFGCGTGSATPFFFDIIQVATLVGCDPSEKSLEQARHLWRSHNVQFSELIPDSEVGFDLAFCNGVFHHILPELRPDAVRSIFDALKPGGYFAFWENNPWNPVTRYAMSRVPFDADAILVWPHQARHLLGIAGFEVIRTDYVFFFPRSLARLRRLEPHLKRVPLGGQYLVLCQKPIH